MNEWNNRFLIDAMDERCWLYNLTDGGETVHQLTWPEGPWEKNEISDTIYKDGEKVPYHEHTKGIETFYIASGSVDVYIRGKHTLAQTGDMLHIMPHVPHGFIFHGEGMIWRECFQEINMSGGIENKCRIKDNYGDELYFEPEFRKRYLESACNINREEPVCEDIKPEEMYELRRHDAGLSTFQFGKVTLRQKVGRWETHGVKEVWQMMMDKGVSFEWNDPYGSSEVYLVVKGSTRWNVLGEEFVAGHDCFVKIPAYAKHSFEVLEDGTELINYGCSARLNDMLEDYVALKTNNPQSIADPADLKAFLRKYGCFLTGCHIAE